MNRFAKMPPKLSEINRVRAEAGLPALVAGKTAKQNKKAQSANRAAHAARCQEIKSLRNSGRKAK